MGSTESVPLLVQCYDCNRSFNPKATRYTYLCPECKEVRRYPDKPIEVIRKELISRK